MATPDRKTLLEMMEQLMKPAQELLGPMTSTTPDWVRKQYNDPDLTKRVIHAISAMTILYLFAVFEDYFPATSGTTLTSRRLTFGVYVPTGTSGTPPLMGSTASALTRTGAKPTAMHSSR